MPERLVELQFPLAGLDRQFAYQSQAPYSTPDALNVRPRETIKGRARGGSRPGLGKYSTDLLGSGSAVRMVADLAVVKSDGLTYWADTFDGDALGSAWVAASWLSGSPSFLLDAAVSTLNQNLGAVRTALTNFDTTLAYQIELYIVPYSGQHWGTYSVFGRMNTTTPIATTDGFAARFTITSTGAWSFQLTSYNATVATAYTAVTGNDTTAKPGWLKVLVNGTSIRVYWQGTQIESQTPTFGGSAGHRFGFGLNATVATGIVLCDTFLIQYYTTDHRQETKTILCASAGGSLYKEVRLGEMAIVTSSYTLASDRLVRGIDHLQKLYIADWSQAISGTDGLQGTGFTKFDSTALTDWTALIPTLNAYDFIMDITAATGGMIAGRYTITAVSAAELTTSPACNSGAGTGTFRIYRSPKIYNPATDTLIPWVATGGTVPGNCPLICRYRDRVVLAAGDDAPHNWYMSKQGDPLGFDYGALSDGAGIAVAGNNTEAGRVGEPIRALIPHSDDYLIFGCTNSIWVCRGDPAYGGSIDCLTHVNGLTGAAAWCRGPLGEIYVLGNDGMCRIDPGASYPVAMSREKLPRELQNVDPQMYTVSLNYDVEFRGVLLHLTGDIGRGNRHWWWDHPTGSFWPCKLPVNYEPTATASHISYFSENSCCIIGGRDGYLRRYRDRHEDDDGTAIDSYVLYGPLRPGGGEYTDGMLRELVASLAARSNPVTWSVLSAATHEDLLAASAYAYATGTWNAGRNYSSYPRVRGGSVMLKLAAYASNRSWEVEKIEAILATGGKLRL